MGSSENRGCGGPVARLLAGKYSWASVVRGIAVVAVTVALLLVVSGCAGGKKLTQVNKEGITAAVAVGSLDDVYKTHVNDTVKKSPQVIQVQDLQGNSIIMNAVMDEESGEMVAVEQLDEIVVEARFRHVAERNGVVDLVFELAVPEQLQRTMWQVRFSPRYMFLGDTLIGDRILITGERFRMVQQWQHRMYGNYLERIVPQNVADTLYGRNKMKERFIVRNGVEITGSLDMGHFRKRILENINRRMDRSKERIYSRFVLDPYPQEGVRLDSVVHDSRAGEIRYFYAQRINIRAGMKRVDMVMDGEVYTNGRRLCVLKGTEPITFYISSISSFTDNTERYLKKVISRDLHFDAIYNVEFGKGKWTVDPKVGTNGAELASLKDNIAQILSNEDYVMDSILITAACSPEGNIDVNRKLSGRRGEAMKEYVMEYMCRYRDSIERSVWEINEGEGDVENIADDEGFGEENIRITEVSEDWESLYMLLEKDTIVSCDKALLVRCFAEENPDRREQLLKGMEGFDYVQKEIYPRLRRVKFNFKLHRKGMLKDTVHTTVLDSVYMRGVEALHNRDYKLAVTLLRPYDCYNTAVAYVCMDYNKSALDILTRLPRDARRDYMLAVVYGRLGDENRAVEYFLNSVEQDDAMRHRGNLDPEISALIKKYGMFNNY